MLAVTDYLGSLQFEGTVGSLYRQHPWVLAAPVGTVRRAVEVLVDEIGVRRLENVVRAYPRALVKGREDVGAGTAAAGRRTRKGRCRVGY